MTSQLEREEELVPYGTLDTEAIGKIGLVVGNDVSASLVRHGITHEPPNLHLRVAMDVRPADDNDDPEGMTELDGMTIGDGEQYAVNTSLQSGKLYTVDKNSADSDEVIYAHGLKVDKADPATWIGSAYDRARVQLGGTLYDIRVGAACSGIEGWLDRVVSKAMAAAMAAAIVLDLEARHKNGTLEQAPYYALAA